MGGKVLKRTKWDFATADRIVKHPIGMSAKIFRGMEKSQ
jgi:hypothetical protein